MLTRKEGKVLTSSSKRSEKWSYEKAGVSIDRGNALVSKIRSLARRTLGPGVIGSIGGFSGFFDPSYLNIQSPLLVGTTDGVGTKLEIAQSVGRHDTVGIDLVAMCVNDLLCTGARPLFFLDYFACGKLDLKIAQKVIAGITTGCREAGCALIGGETAEMPGFYEGSKYDLAGFSVGIVGRNQVIDGKSIQSGDVLIGLASTGFHSNGYSLLRKLFTRQELEGAWGKKLLTPTRIYVKPVHGVLEQIPVKGIAHITGGAFLDKLPRVLPKGMCARINLGSWPIPAPFIEAQRRGRLDQKELYRTFNMGIGMILVVGPDYASRVKTALQRFRLDNWVIGNIMKNKTEKVIFQSAKEEKE